MSRASRDEPVKEVFGRITQEVFEARWIHSLLCPNGKAFSDRRFDHDRKGAEQLLRARGWDLPEVAQYVDEINQGISVVPKPPPKTAARPKRKGIAGIFGGGALPDGWEQSVRDWDLLDRRHPASPPATSLQRMERVREALAAIHAPKRGGTAPLSEVVRGLKVERLFSEPERPETEDDDRWGY